MSADPEKELIRELFITYRQMMYKTALGILHNRPDAEDAVQNTFLQIINDLERIARIPSNERALYFTYITEHNAINIYRKKNAHPTEDIDEHFELDSGTSVEDEALSRLSADEIRSALADLSDRDHDLLYLYLFKEMNYREISGIMDIPEDYVRVYVQRARKRFIKILKKRGAIDDV